MPNENNRTKAKGWFTLKATKQARTNRHRHTDTQAHTHRHSSTHTHTDIQTLKHTHRHTDTQAHTHRVAKQCLLLADQAGLWKKMRLLRLSLLPFSPLFCHQPHKNMREKKKKKKRKGSRLAGSRRRKKKKRRGGGEHAQGWRWVL